MTGGFSDSSVSAACLVESTLFAARRLKSIVGNLVHWSRMAKTELPPSVN
jgi:hypothetical protein